MNKLFQLQNKKLKEQRYFILGTFILFLTFCCLFFIFFTPTIMLKGKETITVDIGTQFSDPGIDIYSLSKIDDVKINQNVNTKEIGKYHITYTVYSKQKQYTKKRTVLVKDLTPPKLTLLGDRITKVCRLEDYVELGATAIDNYDLDITSQIITKNDNHTIQYTVVDSSGNKTVKTRKVIEIDVEKPQIKLNGEAYMQLYQNEEYTELGATATDNCSNDLTPNINIISTVNSSEIGEYSVTYVVKDEANNIQKVTRTVNVIQKPTTDKMIYLTFDDGPSTIITPKILDILKEEKVKATFFVIHHGEELNYLIKRAYDEGHTIALHSYSHNYKEIYASEEAYFNDLEQIEKKVESIIGIKSKIIRFPGGSSNTISKFNPGIMSRLATLTNQRGYIYFDWNVTSGDASGARNIEDVYENVINQLNPKINIVLFHDFENNYKTLDSLRDIIQTAKQLGYTFDKITESTPIIRHKIAN